nr:MAG: hypothetical protein DIU55_02280 [Bacillota bacterium]
MLQRALRLLRFRTPEPAVPVPDHQALMKAALARVETARQMMREARTLEELDLARSALQQAQAEVQHVIRTAKREQGVALRPIAETEEVYRTLWERLKGRSSRSAGPHGQSGQPPAAEG